MPVLENPKGQRILFMHIPKTGGTTIESCFSGNNILYAKSYVGTALKVNPQHFDAETVKMLGIDLLFPLSFAVVRNPYDRIMSEYKHYHRSRLLWLSFDAFVMLIGWRLNQSKFCYDNHVRPQIDFCLPCTHCYYFEDGMEHIIASIASDFGLMQGQPIKWLNRSSSDIKHEFSTYSVKRINQIYASDFEVFNYALLDTKNGWRRRVRLTIFVELVIKLTIEVLWRSTIRRYSQRNQS